MYTFFWATLYIRRFCTKLGHNYQPWHYQPSHNNTKDERLHRNNALTLLLFSLLLSKMRLCPQREINLDMYVKCPKCLSDFNQSLTGSANLNIKFCINFCTEFVYQISCIKFCTESVNQILFIFLCIEFCVLSFV